MKAMIVTSAPPGHQIGAEKAGQAQVLQSFIDFFQRRGDQIVLVLANAQTDFLWLRTSSVSYRIVGRTLGKAFGRYVAASPASMLTVCAWKVFSLQPRGIKLWIASARDRLRRMHGFSHVVGSFLPDAERRFVEATAAREQPDIVLYDSIFNACGRIASAEHWVITHDVKYQRIASFAALGIDTLPRGFTKEAERAILEDTGNAVAIQGDEARELQRLAPRCRVVTVPVAMPSAPVDPAAAVAGRCLFVGSGSFHNLDGIRWFLDACWPAILTAVPEATLHICGSVCFRLGRLPQGVVAGGVVDDLHRIYAQASVVIAPLRAGSGLKVKIVEAVVHGVPAVTTPIGAQGLEELEPAPFLVAETAAHFSDCTIRVLRSSNLRGSLRAAAERCRAAFRPDAAFAEFEAAIPSELAPPAGEETVVNVE